MKIITINSHSLVEVNYENKFFEFIKKILNEKPDIIALQEVNQTCYADIINQSYLSEMFFVKKDTVVRSDNYAARVANVLKQYGLKYYWSWLPIKRGYGKYDEGLAIFSLSAITETNSFLISDCDDYDNWKTRKVLGIKNENDDWFYTTHLGWWNDDEEPFYKQWERLHKQLKNKGRVWLMGDFNNASHIRNEGYDLVLNSGWYDTYTEAIFKDAGFTVEKPIDGWNDIDKSQKMRIDYIFCNKETKPYTSEVIFDGKNSPIISDHYGIMITYKNL